MLVIHAIANTGGNNYFEVLGDQTTLVSVGGYFQVRNSTSNNGLYRLASSVFVNGYTRLTPTTAIPSAVNDGVLNAGVYVIDFQDATLPGKTPVVIAPATYNTTATSLTLPSRGAFDYGERLVENAVHLLENFAGVNSPANPTVGQQWYDYPNRTMKTYADARWSSDLNINDGVLTFTDAQNSNSKVVITASEPAGKTATGITIYPVADVASGQPIFRVLNSAGAVHLAVLRTDSVTTDTRFVSTGSGLNDFRGTVAIGAPATTFSSGSVLNVDGSMDVFGKVILDENAAVHGLVYRGSGSSVGAVNSVWKIYSASSDSATFFNSDGQAAVIGSITKFFTPVQLTSTLNVTGATNLTTATMSGNTSMTNASVSGTLTVNTVAATNVTATNLTVTGTLASNATGTTLLRQLDASNQPIINVPTPSANQDAANKKYVDDTNFLSKLSDVFVTGVTDGQSLTFNASTSKWNATTLTAASISGIDNYIKDKAAESVGAGTHVGITPTYNSATKALSFVVSNQTFNATGDATGTGTLNWSGAVAIPLTLKASGVTAGTYTKVLVNSKGLVTSGSTLVPSDIPTLDPSKIVGTYDLANTYKVTNAIDPTAAGDYVTLRFLQNYSFDAGTF